MDTVGEILWFLMFITPVITVPLFLKLANGRSKGERVVLGLVAAAGLSFILFFISMSIAMRDGLGPT